MPARSDHPRDRVRLATPDDRAAVVRTVAAAFALDPAFWFFFPDPAQFGAMAATFAGALFDVRVAVGTVWVADDGAAVAMWEPPAGTARGRLDALPAEVVDRLDAWQHAVEPLMPHGKSWYLGVLATHPDRAGEGLGRLVAEPGLARAAADGLPAYLETATAANVAMYVRRGWTVVDSVSVAGAAATATVLRHD